MAIRLGTFVKDVTEALIGLTWTTTSSTIRIVRGLGQL